MPAWLRRANLWLLLALQIPFYWYFSSSRILYLERPVLLGFGVALSVLTLVTLVNLLLARLPSKRVARALNFFFVAFYGLLLAYRWRRGAPLDFAFFFANAGELVSSSGVRALAEAGGFAGWGLLAALITMLVVLERRFDALSTFPESQKPWRIVGVLLVANGAFLALRIPNEFLLFGRSIGHYFFHPFDAELQHADAAERFPLYHPSEKPRSPIFNARGRPHVFVILMESFSSDFVEKKDDAGHEITPVFNRLIQRGAYHELFFANSMQSERGQSATLCSVIPSFRRKIMTTYAHVHLTCLPKVMRSAGYRTIWAQGHPDLEFDNIGVFMPKIGFDEVIAMDAAPEERLYVWGWGLQDDIFFRKFFTQLDVSDHQRVFAVLATISNHMQFDAMPAEERRLFPKPATFKEQYLNSIHLADAYLGAFFEELERRDLADKSLVVLLGDHGYPVGQHGVTSNEASFYNELFRVPLLILGARIEPFRNDRIAYSQLDIAPSLQQWLGIEHDNAFAGVRIAFRAGDLPSEQHWIPLVQPYDGGYIAGVRWPHKLVRSLTTGDTLFFDLAGDPMEEENLADSSEHREPFDTLKRELAQIFLNQRLLDEDRFVPH